MAFEIRGKLTSRIGRTVRYTPPEGLRKAGASPLSGTIIDEVWADESLNESPRHQAKSNEPWGDYSFCSQLIRWKIENTRFGLLTTDSLRVRISGDLRRRQQQIWT
jgi:hypothetical protein